ncbi:MAG: hypothetical protein KA155_07100 [Alphaproteobacteria bacterium]|jgi:hypothetical protein|nr:hypothetical protein [Alphaproteobacteria bacterium]
MVGSKQLFHTLTCDLLIDTGDRIFVMLVGCFDESEKEGVLVVGGYIAPADKWDSFIPQWQAQLDKDEVEAYERVKFRRNHKRNIPYHEIIKNHVSGAVFCAVDIAGLHKAVEETEWVKDFVSDLGELKRRAKNPYHRAVKYVLLGLAEQKKVLGLSGPIFTVFDEKTEAPQVLSAYEYLKYTSNDELRKEFGGIAFLDDKQFSPLQSADFYAGWSREAYMAGKDLRKEHPFPWETEDKINSLLFFQDYAFFKDEFEKINAPENINKFLEYEKTNASSSQSS